MNFVNRNRKKLFTEFFFVIHFSLGGESVLIHRKFIAVTIAAALLIGTITGCGGQKNQIDTTDGVTNILDYVTVDFSGKDGEGTAYVNVDYDGIELEMVGGEEKIKDLDEVDDLAALTKYINAVSSISFSIDKNEGLSNKDEVTVTVTYDSTAAEAAGVVFGSQKSKTFEVKGLK